MIIVEMSVSVLDNREYIRALKLLHRLLDLKIQIIFWTKAINSKLTWHLKYVTTMALYLILTMNSFFQKLLPGIHLLKARSPPLIPTL